MQELNALLLAAARAAFEGEPVDWLNDIRDDFNLFEAVDSLAIVNLLLETEGSLESSLGRYVPLADDSIFDAARSPLLRWGTWVGYVKEKIA